MKPVALITGASRGIGRSIAIRLAEKGYNLSLVARSEAKLEELKKELSSRGADSLALPFDLLHSGSPKAIIEKSTEHFGRIDLLLNNAGIALNKAISDSDEQLWDEVFRVNVRSPFFICKNAIPWLEKSDNPLIINIGSVVDHKGYINQGIYASSKHALAGFTSVLAKEVQDKGIRVHLISPGGVNTEMVSSVRPDLDTSALIAPEEIADIVEFLCDYRGKGTIDRISVRRFNGLPFD